MSEPIHILIAEDLPTDFELAQREIRQVLDICVFQRVETREDFEAALESFKPDLIISDYRMPRFDGLSALRLALECVPMTPVIILTGAINEDTAVECMKAGAVDYVIKEHIKRLGQAVLHALEQKRLRQERRRSEEALRESEARYRTLVNTLPDAITVTDAQANITYASPAALVFYGHYHEEEVLGHSILEWVAPSYHRQAREQLRLILLGASITDQEYLLQRKDGSSFYGEISASCLRDAQNHPVGTIIVVRDITERKRAAEALRTSEERYRLVSELTSDYLYAMRVQQDGSIVPEWTTGAFSRITGYSGDPEQNARTSWIDLIHPDDRPTMLHHLQANLAGKVDVAEYRIIDKHGQIHWLREYGRPIWDAVRQRVSRIIGAVQDITERKQAEEAQSRLEEQLRQAQKLESIGRLAGGVAHDFNNLITVIRGYCDLMEDKLGSGDPVLAEVDQIRQASARAAALTRQLLAFSRSQILSPAVLDLNDLVANLRGMLERLIGEDITLTTILQPGLRPITADPGQIEQVLMNLVVNARDAMPTGGLLTLETSNIYLDESYARTHFEAPLGPCVLLSVTDTGQGMDAETQARIFEPFFTTKLPGKGTGLGLATAYGIIKQSGGHITVYSEPGRGTTFKIYLPASTSISDQIEITQPHAGTYGGTETILLVEDDETVRELACATLRANGYTVLDACHGSEALVRLHQHPGPIDLLVTDVVMPEVGGRELAERLTAAHPKLKALFMSGYTDETIVRHGLLTAEVEYLPKPFSLGTLLAKVREVLDA